MTKQEVLPMRVMAHHLVDSIAFQFDGPDAAIWELFRNSCTASMPAGSWDPSKVFIEITLQKQHPLCPDGILLSFLDHGSGLNEIGKRRYLELGKDDPSAKNGHHGASQKGSGRIAALQLISTLSPTDPKTWGTGYYVFSRPQSSGNITMISVNLLEFQENQGFLASVIAPDNSNLSPRLRKLSGSFTEIAIPYSVYKDPRTLAADIKWRMPRKQSQAIRVEVDGRPVSAPPLASELVFTDKASGAEIYLDVAKDNELDDPHGGVWLCDAATGFRVAPLAKLYGYERIPYPLCEPRLRGDVFVEGVMENQDAHRNSLTRTYLKSAKWRKVMRFLFEVAQHARTLIGEEDTFSSDADTKNFDEIVGIFGQVYGEATPGVLDLLTEELPTVPGEQDTKGGGGGNGGGGGGDRTPRKLKPHISSRKREVTTVMIDGKRYFFSPLTLDDCTVAECDGEVIRYHPRYPNFPKQKDARLLFIMSEILTAVADSRFPNKTRQITRFRNLNLTKILKTMKG